MQTAGIIGGSGFIGSHVTRLFLEHGYKVKVSATDISKTEKYEHLKTLPNAENLDIVALNVQDEAALASFVQGCDILVHGGTPFQLDVQNPQTELFDPTIKGTENLLNILSQTPGLKKVVFIASVAAYNANFPLPATDRSADHVYTETDAPFCNEQCHPYAQSKYLADQVVRKYVNDNPGANFEIVSVAPVFVTGHSLSGRQDSTSTGLQFLFKNKIAPNPFIQMFYDQDIEFALVDVEDVAEATYKAAITPGLHGKHYLLSNETWPVSDIVLMLNKQAPEGEPKVTVSGALAEKELGIQFAPAQVSLGRY
jgi:dihydroflavonol-4-reductase